MCAQHNCPPPLAPPPPNVAHVCECVCVCVCVRGTGSHHSGVYSPSEIVLTTACVQIHTNIFTVSVTRLCSPLGLELIKLTWKLKLVIIVRGVTFPTRACGVWPITMHWVSWPIRADCTCWKERLCRKRRLREAGHRGTTIMYSIWKIMCFLNIKACQHILLHQIHKLMIFKIASYDPFNTHTGRPAALMCSECRVCSQLYSSIVLCVSGWCCWWSGLVRSELDSGVLQCLCTRCSSLLGLHHCCSSESLNDPPELNQLDLHVQMCF